MNRLILAKEKPSVATIRDTEMSKFMRKALNACGDGTRVPIGFQALCSPAKILLDRAYNKINWLYRR